jgi:hypothetical protein
MGSAREMIRDLVKIFDFYFRIPMFVRVKHDIGPLLAGAETHIWLYFNVSEPLGRDAFFELSHYLLRASGLAIDILTNETDSTHTLLLVS